MKSFFEQKFQTLKETGYVEGEIELLCSDGSAIPVWRKEKAIYNEKNEFVGSVIYNRDISSHKRAEEEKISLEARLQRARKMEAIGTLAGGVAHDLNNVLGGIVGYPELLMLQLPENSPLRKPLLTMQQSGQKAAAIVQDLLTLARRGVATEEVVNVNQIITEYLKSPEYEKLKLYHPNVHADANLEPNLAPVLGSPVHLSKTIMNLVSNAVEAMNNGGTVFITTENRSIKNPIKGFETIEEGDYAMVTVSDTGVGIPSEDIEKIFEPFYTKKVMGRSGTGLGMAVVWGTAKDHKGFIDVQSSEGKGTTFTLYFPITRQKLAKRQSLVSIEDYRGNGAAIIVVDDVKEQREIASGMLRELGYSVTSFPSGLEAVGHMRNNSADLLVLDMIMDPGIDGLDTYKRILQLHPGQKAIIVSGFSETERVREAQRLGARSYIKKPYTLDELGVAVRAALDN
jgi:signal transduction histidine kinase/CheY-like chemotaxis protein